MNPAVRVTGLTKRFGEKLALHELGFEAQTGEILGFVGPNGAGKSTCLRILLGILECDAGAVSVLGHDPRTASLEIRRRCSYLPGETSVYAFMTGAEFLDFALGFHARRLPLPERANSAFALPLHKKVRTYSAGMKQKLALLATLCVDVELYVLDEPDRALDATARLELREVLRAMRSEGRTILLSSHHLAEVDALADRTVFVFDGHAVPTERVDAARELLRREVRLRLVRDVELPDGTESVVRDPDGSLRVRTVAAPLVWLSRLDPELVAAAELGSIRLEDLYRVLGDEPTPPTEAPQ